MVTEYGMSDLGPIQYEGNSKVFIGRDYGQRPAYSEQVAYEIDKEVRNIVERARQDAHEILNKYRDKLDVIAEKLLEIETLDKSQIKALFETGEMPEDETKEVEPIETADTFEEASEKVAHEEDVKHSNSEIADEPSDSSESAE